MDAQLEALHAVAEHNLPQWTEMLISPRPVFGASAHRICAAYNQHKLAAEGLRDP